MSVNHHRRNYSSGASAPAAFGQNPSERDRSPRGASYASVPPSAPKIPVPLAGNVIELYPGSAVVPPGARRRTGLMGAEAGMATAEYAIATLAAVGFAGLLVFILRSDEVRGFLLNLIRTALALP
jgi:Protein of unknown function (DUF4244)